MGVFVEAMGAESGGKGAIGVHHVYAGEGSWNVSAPLVRNRLGSALYAYFNRVKFGRFADVNSLVIVLDGQAGANPLRPLGIQSDDFAGPTQTWARGDKGTVLHYSFDAHYPDFVPWGQWKKLEGGGDRPIVYLNTQNHLIGWVDRNPDLWHKHLWVDGFPVMEGGRADAEQWAVEQERPARCS